MVVMGALLVIVSGVALAATITGTNAGEILNGDPGGQQSDDQIAGGGGSDELKGKDGNDDLFGDFGGNEKLNGGKGDDFLNAANQTPGDLLDPGEGVEPVGDVCVADKNDKVVDTQAGTTPKVQASDSGGAFGDCERITVVKPVV
jgi:hypothetical protein